MVYEAFFIDYTSITTYDGSASQSSCWKDDSLLGVIVAMSSAHVYMEITSNCSTTTSYSGNDINTLLESTVTYLNHSPNQISDINVS